ncbi:MAG: type II secretion system F family protein [Bacteriovoracaceae bacterium]|nr:type II secretion system F family protein [Bacteriovoracaceae bacterium]
MAQGKFKYEGVNAEGRKVQGEVEGKDIRQVKRSLRRQGIRARKVTAPSPLDIDLGMLMVEKGLAKPFGKVELNRFTRQLSILINAGVPILECLEILAKQEVNPSLKAAIKQIMEDVGGGKSLSEGLSAQKGFDKLYCSLVKAGEAAGILDTILIKLSEFMEKQEGIKKKIKGALTYPVIVCVIGLAVTWGLMVFVVPQFVDMLKDSNQEIPTVTQLVMDTSAFFQEYTLLMLPAFFVLFILFTNFIKTKEGKIKWDRFTMKSPVFGGIIIKGNLSGFTRTLATMLSAGVDILESLEVCIDTIDNTQIQKDLKQVREAVVKGKSITEPLGRIKYFPPLVNQMVKVGESTGNLDEMLVKVSDVFEDETEELIDNMTKLIEPAILVGLGGMVGTVLIAMYLPIFMSAGGV